MSTAPHVYGLCLSHRLWPPDHTFINATCLRFMSVTRIMTIWPKMYQRHMSSDYVCHTDYDHLTTSLSMSRVWLYKINSRLNATHPYGIYFKKIIWLLYISNRGHCKHTNNTDKYETIINKYGLEKSMMKLCKLCRRRNKLDIFHLMCFF